MALPSISRERSETKMLTQDQHTGVQADLYEVGDQQNRDHLEDVRATWGRGSSFKA